MTRLSSPARPGPLTRLALRISRQKVARVTGRETEGMIEPMEAYARSPRLLLGYGMLEQATAKQRRVEPRLKVLVELANVIALENMRGRFNLALGIGASRFSEGMVCAVPEDDAQDHGLAQAIGGPDARPAPAAAPGS
jgi:hypothetical protein